ncbi:MAG: class I SAM-dependent methyltransferase [Anaerolineales bacterium]
MADPGRKSAGAVREDFDRIAAVADEGWDHNRHYHAFLLRQLPPHGREALDIGCGSGSFARLLARRFDRVTAVDLSPGMIRRAGERSADYPNIAYQTADIMEWPWPKAVYGCIASIATLHHLPLEEMLRRCAAALEPDGVLLVLDLYTASSLVDYLTGAAAVPLGAALRLLHGGGIREPWAVREAWARHGRNERYPTLAQVRAICRDVLPGAAVRRHLLWRYSIVWRKGAHEGLR